MTTIRSRRRDPALALAVGLALLAAAPAAPAAQPQGTTPMTRIAYPPARVADQVDQHHGVAVADPYRWLEDVDSEETRAWVEAQNELTFAFLRAIPARERLRARLTELWDHARYSPPLQRGGRYFFSKNDGLQNQAVLYVQDGLAGQPRVLLDPNALSPDGTIALSGFGVSEDGRFLAYATSESGSDWQTWRVRAVDTGQDLDDVIRWAKFTGAAWTHDHRGFFYARYDEPAPAQTYQETNYFQKLYYHRLGTPQSDDALIYQRPDRKDWGFAAQVSEDGRWLVISVWQGTDRRNRVHILDLQDPARAVAPLLDDFDASYDFVGNDGTLFYFQTDLEAPRGRVIAVDAARPDRAGWRTLIPEEHDALQDCAMLNDGFVLTYLRDACHAIKLADRHGSPRGELELPGLGSAGGFTGRRADAETFYAFTSFLNPTEIYRHDFATGRSTLLRAPELAFDFSPYETRQVFYESKDGTRVPMFLVHKRGLRLDGGNPTLLYGYGGFNASLLPAFSPGRLVWLEMGGVYAQPNLRGGGEYGEEWHRAGMLENKQNTFDDFIAAAEWLVANGYTSPSRLAISGGSNGGLLVGACANQRPELFGAALPAVGVMDMLRFHLFTIGWAWVSDYGSSEDPEQFKTLHAYSPYHNLRPGVAYPATLITTADHDDRVVPGHSFKYAARLQACHAGDAPVLIRIETKAGHGAGKPTAKIIEEVADQYAFLVRVFGLE